MGKLLSRGKYSLPSSICASCPCKVKERGLLVWTKTTTSISMTYCTCCLKKAQLSYGYTAQLSYDKPTNHGMKHEVVPAHHHQGHHSMAVHRDDHRHPIQPDFHLSVGQQQLPAHVIGQLPQHRHRRPERLADRCSSCHAHRVYQGGHPSV